MEELSDDSTKERSNASRTSTHDAAHREVTKEQLESGTLDKHEAGQLHLTWDTHDSTHPRNWSKARKWLITGIALLGTLLLPLNGTSITVATEEINVEFGISDATFPNSYWPVTSWSLGGAVFIILFLPLMEDLGVRLGYMASFVVFYAMLIGQARAQSFATLIVTRFFSGGCVALQANTISSMIPDVWATDEQRSLPVAIYIILYIAGSTLGPVVFAPIMEYVHDWRWIFYAQLILYAVLAVPSFLILRETRSGVLLRRQATALRKSTGQDIISHESAVHESLPTRLQKAVARPFYLLFTEPVLFASTLWSAFCFGTVFSFTQSTAQVYITLYGWEFYSVGYIQAAIVVGEVIGFFITLYGARLYLNSAKRNKEMPNRPIPEARLYVSVPASFIGLVGGMLVYAWTSYPYIHWICPSIGLAMVGVGIQVVVAAVADYVFDAYAASDYAGSAISAVACGENIVAGFLPLAAQSLYTNLGFQWASSLLALVALVLSMAPVILIWKGRWFRKRSPFMQSNGLVERKPPT